MNTPVVRLAVPQDRDGLVNHCHMLHEENGLFALSVTRIQHLLDRFFNREGALIGVIGDVGEPDASFYLSFECPYYSDQWQLVEFWNFVMPPRDHKAGHARALIEWAKTCSDEAQLPLIISILSNQRLEAKERLYERQMERAGAFFVHNKHFAGHTAWAQH